jgi:uncharacterized protein (TIGR02186 family)
MNVLPRSAARFAVPFALAITCSLLPGRGAAEPATAPLRVMPETIEVGAFFHGATVEVVGELPAGYQAAVLLSGGERALDLKKKGKVWGVLWMTVGGVRFEHVPELYLLATTAALDGLASATERQRLPLGLDALGASLKPAAEERDTGALAGELVKLREDEGLFNVAVGGVRVEPQPGGPGLLSAEFSLPARVRDGSYDVRLWGFRDGAATLLATSKLSVRRAGMTRLVGALARQHGLLYGILAVLAALGVGLLTGAVFGRGASKGH